MHKKHSRDLKIRVRKNQGKERGSRIMIQLKSRLGDYLVVLVRTKT